MAEKQNTDYLKFEAMSMLDFLKSKIEENGKYTDQIYTGSNLSILLETLSAMFEVLTYNLNFQASEATFNGVQIYENMLKIVNMLGYKARPSIASTIHGSLTADVYLDKILPKITQNTKDIRELATNIQTALISISNPKTLTKDLMFRNPMGTAIYTLLENVQAYPEFINLNRNNIFYWINQNYTNELNQILSYLKHIWGISNISLDTTIDELASIAELDKTTFIEKYSTLPSGLTNIKCNLRISSSDIDNFVVAINGGWNSYFVTSETTGERNEQYNFTALNVDSLNISDGTLFAAVYDPNTIETQGIEIYKPTLSLDKHLPSDKVFEYFVDVNKCITIKFGDGVNGSQLPQNYSITLFFIVNDGAAGEASQTVFTNNSAELVVGGILSRNTDPNVDSSTLNDKFIFDNINIDNISKSDCSIISKLLSTNNTMGEYSPKMKVYFNPSSSSSKFQPIETVEEIRAIAPKYNRANNRIITQNDLDIILKRNYVQYVYDTKIMDNFDYMSKFYNWLYSYDSLSKEIAASGYKFSDSCNFNDIYIWLKGYSNYPVNDFIKKTMQRSLNIDKVITSELVFLDSINTYFFPYVGNIGDDIDWLLYAKNKYEFLITQYNQSDEYYKKWKTLDDLFEKVNGKIVNRPTKKLLDYIFSGESSELKINVEVYRDPNINENMSTIKTNVVDIVNKTFNIQNNKLGKAIKLNDLNEEIGNISGIRKIRTTKSKNVNIYTETSPIINNIKYYNEETALTLPVILDYDIEYPRNAEKSYIEFDLDYSAIKHLTNFDGSALVPKFKKMMLSTGQVVDIYPELLDDDVDSSIATYRMFLNEFTKIGEEYTGEEISNFSSAYSIYVEYERQYSPSNNVNDIIALYSYSNKLRFAVTQLNKEAKPEKFRITTYLDNWSNSSIELTESNIAKKSILDEPVWEVSDSAYSLSFAKFTNSLINARDFDVIGAGFVTLEDFCFPAIYRDITSLIVVTDEQNTTYNINF